MRPTARQARGHDGVLRGGSERTIERWLTDAAASDGKITPLRQFLANWTWLLRQNARVVVLITTAAVVGGIVAGFAEPMFQKYFFDTVAEHRTGKFLPLAIFAVGFYTSTRLLGYAAALGAQRLAIGITKTLTGRMLAAFYERPYADVVAHDQGYFVSRVYDEPARFAGESVEVFVALVSGALTFSAAIGVAIWLSWQITLVLLVIVPGLFYIGRRYAGKIAHATRQGSEESARLRASLGRAVESYTTVHSFTLFDTVLRHVEHRLATALGASYRTVAFSARFRVTSRIFLSYAELVVLLGTGMVVVAGHLTIGGLVGLMTAYWKVVGSFDTLSTQIPAVTRVHAQLARITEFEDSRRRATLRHADDAIVLRGVSFAYGDTPLLVNVNLRLQRGDRLLVTGANGSGKSTLAHIISGFLDPRLGQVLLPKDPAIASLLLPFAFIPGSARDNLGFDDFSQEKREECQRLMRDLRMTMSLDQDPATMSQGEQRKLQLLMVLMQDASFIVLDEPLSHIDAASRDAAMEAILQASAGRGLMVIMHGDDKYWPAFNTHVDLTGASRNRAAPSSCFAMAAGAPA
jgi:ABC-type multidrug transport system fused ATPase/permease subunit